MRERQKRVWQKETWREKTQVLLQEVKGVSLCRLLLYGTPGGCLMRRGTGSPPELAEDKSFFRMTVRFLPGTDW